MAEATIVQICDGLVDELKTQKFSRPIEPRRLYDPIFPLDEMDCLHVTVVPGGLVRLTKARDKTRNEIGYTVDVGVQQRVEDVEKIDDLLFLVEEIGDYCHRLRPRLFTAAICIDVRNDPAYDRRVLKEMHLFTSVIGLTFKVLT